MTRELETIDKSLEETVLSEREEYSGRLLHVLRREVKLTDGRLSAREMIAHPGAAAMVVLDDENCTVLERQWRSPLDRAFWEIPAGKISARAALRFVIVNALLFIVTASTINLLTGLLSPVALFVILMYSYCKRFTALAHLVLGLGLGIAPVGAYIAVTGHFAWPPCILALLVMTWCGGFDIIYALQDADFDRKNGLYSIPARFSARVSLLFSILLHAVSVAALFWFGSFCPQNGWLWLGEGLFTLILVAEHLLVTPTRQRNIGIAFGTLNGIASTVLAVFVITALLRG